MTSAHMEIRKGSFLVSHVLTALCSLKPITLNRLMSAPESLELQVQLRPWNRAVKQVLKGLRLFSFQAALAGQWACKKERHPRAHCP